MLAPPPSLQIIRVHGRGWKRTTTRADGEVLPGWKKCWGETPTSEMYSSSQHHKQQPHRNVQSNTILGGRGSPPQADIHWDWLQRPSYNAGCRVRATLKGLAWPECLRVEEGKVDEGRGEPRGRGSGAAVVQKPPAGGRGLFENGGGAPLRGRDRPIVAACHTRPTPKRNPSTSPC